MLQESSDLFVQEGTKDRSECLVVVEDDKRTDGDRTYTRSSDRHNEWKMSLDLEL